MFIRRPFGPAFGGFAHPGISIFALFVMIAFWVIVALLIVALVRGYRHGSHHGPHQGYAHATGPAPERSVSSPAIDILKERFARGEVSEEEFTRRLALLKDS